MPTKSSSCCHCGLGLRIQPHKSETHLSFDGEEWNRLCKYPDLGSPVLCLMQIASAASPEDTIKSAARAPKTD
jgi:hypothetical protein